jgi:hypothetical protein
LGEWFRRARFNNLFLQRITGLAVFQVGGETGASGGRYRVGRIVMKKRYRVGYLKPREA